jgi:hypothetical protein
MMIGMIEICTPSHERINSDQVNVPRLKGKERLRISG